LGQRDIYRISADGEGSLFATIPPGFGTLASLTLDSTENLFALFSNGVYRFDGGDPATGRQLSTLPVPTSPNFGHIRLSPDQTVIYVTAMRQVWGIDPVSGTVVDLGAATINPDWRAGAAMAVYVPEPATGVLVLAYLLLLLRRA
jgi:hypothetical protein